ncbi:hypothetical protein, partial [Streptomyces sp. NPDC005336]|uniref:morphogenic membrane protein MmpB n=1 Tax=Streptomyces sp. NPDC005336 TaxID=3157035 RepID=UPI0033B317ED
DLRLDRRVGEFRHTLGEHRRQQHLLGGAHRRVVLRRNGSGGLRIGPMLWSEPPDEPPEELRRAQAMLRRARTLLAISVMIALCLLTLRP